MLALALVLATTFGGAGVHGTVLIDPARPVCAVGLPCSAPDRGEVLAFWRGSRRTRSVTTAANGGFRVALRPGLYRLTLPRRVGYGRVSPRAIRVPRGRNVLVTIRVDVGIR